MKKLNINQIIKKLGLSFFTLFFVLSITACSNQNANENTAENEKVSEETSDNNEVEESNEESKNDEKKEIASETIKDSDDGEILDCCGRTKNKDIFVTADYVKDVIDGKEDVGDYVIAEVTWGEADASEDYLKNHIPGAIHINTDTIEEGPVWNLKSDDEIVKLIDGGIKTWMDKGYETEDGENKAVAKEDFKGEYPAHPEFIVTLEEAKKDIEDENDDIQYISTRTYEEYIGETSGYSYIPKAGEIPGAIYGHDEADYKNPDGTYLSYDDMVQMLQNEGVDTEKEMVFYCGTGWRAALPVLRFYEKGIQTKLFDGGWNEWQMHDELPAQLGDPKDGGKIIKVGDLSNDKATE
ncbi:sulfurtransferase [uncultured Anaerococcus sp.]|uniref:sulfurtransferase n=1 Tax=uncultured Anaerococcus sp. TaxID=293428 RepID=UPI0025FD6974|nr:rhodanese-like domain-containing protein [uncultured Anaerococcus sp.]